MNFIDLIKYPILSEKTGRLLEQNLYCFAVDPKADKSSIKNAIEVLFSVKVVSVNTSRNPRKKKRVGKFFGTKSQTKRSFVKLAPEDSITFFENV